MRLRPGLICQTSATNTHVDMTSTQDGRCPAVTANTNPSQKYSLLYRSEFSRTKRMILAYQAQRVSSTYLSHWSDTRAPVRQKVGSLGFCTHVVVVQPLCGKAAEVAHSAPCHLRGDRRLRRRCANHEVFAVGDLTAIVAIDDLIAVES